MLQPTQVGIIAGAGRFPFHVAREAKRQGYRVIAIGIRGWADAALALSVDVYEEVDVGRLAHLIARMKHYGLKQALMAGKVTKAVLLDPQTLPDSEMTQLLSQVPDFSASALLGEVARRLSAEGVTLLDSSTFLKASLCPEGVLTSKEPTPRDEENIVLGLQVTQALASLDVGQTILVKDKVVVAVEALEGTDKAIQRAYELAGAGLVMVKMASPKQDRRFDLPVIGEETLKQLQRVAASCLAVEAGATLLLDRDAVLSLANEGGISIIGLLAARPS